MGQHDQGRRRMICIYWPILVIAFCLGVAAGALYVGYGR